MADGNDHGRPRIINPNVILGRGGRGGAAPGLEVQGTMNLVIPPEQEEKIRATLQEMNALASKFHEEIKAALADLETLEKKRDALHAQEST